MGIRIPWESCENKLLGSSSRVSDLVSLGRGPRTCTSNKFQELLMLRVWDRTFRMYPLTLHYQIPSYQSLKNIPYLFGMLEFGLAKCCSKPGSCWQWLRKLSADGFYSLEFDLNIVTHFWVHRFFRTFYILWLLSALSLEVGLGLLSLCLPLQPYRAGPVLGL